MDREVETQTERQRGRESERKRCLYKPGVKLLYLNLSAVIHCNLRYSVYYYSFSEDLTLIRNVAISYYFD